MPSKHMPVSNRVLFSALLVLTPSLSPTEHPQNGDHAGPGKLYTISLCYCVMIFRARSTRFESSYFTVTSMQYMPAAIEQVVIDICV